MLLGMLDPSKMFSEPRWNELLAYIQDLAPRVEPPLATLPIDPPIVKCPPSTAKNPEARSNNVVAYREDRSSV